MKTKIVGFFICMLLLATAIPMVNAQRIDSDKVDQPRHTVAFSQLDWYYNGMPLVMHSLWGRIDLHTVPDSAFWYVNIVATAGYAPAWIVQNYPIFPVAYHLPLDQVVYFNIADLGLHEGMPLSSLQAIVSYERAPLQTQPQGNNVSYMVIPSDRDAWGHTVDPPQKVGFPRGHIASGPVTDALKHTNISSVQEAPNNCITGAYARSIKWLDTTYDLKNLPPGKTAQDVYNDLAGLGVGHGTGHHDEEQMLETKAAYLKGQDGRAVTKFVDLTGWMSNNVAGCTEENPANLKDWLQYELKTEDVEICYDHHCIMLAGIYTQQGCVFLEYRDDERQGNDTAGDTTEKEGQLLEDAGQWYLDGSPIDYVVSESINNPPAPPSINGPSSGKPRVPVQYSFSSIDPDGNQVRYFIDWGDGSAVEQIGPYNSGAAAQANHTWQKRGTYTIKAKAVDPYNASSNWSTLPVKMPYQPPRILSWILEHFPHAFPVLRRLLGF